MPLSNFAFDRYISQELSNLTECHVPDLASEPFRAGGWLSEFILNSTFGHPIDHGRRRFGLGFLRRAEAAFMEHALFRTALIEYISTTPLRPSQYFRCIHHLESTIAAAWQAFDFARRVFNEDVFTKGGGSPHERLNFIYNTARHFDPDELPAGHLHPVWLSNRAVHSATAELSFAELADMLREIGEFANKLAKVAIMKGKQT